MKPKKILVVQTGKLGDMVCTTPLFRAIKRTYPDAVLWVAGSALNAKLLKGNPHISRYIPIDALRAKDLQRERIGAAVLLNPNPGVLAILLRARISKVIVPKVVGGYSPYMSLSYRFWSLFATAMPLRMGHYAPQEYLNMLQPLGVSADDTRKELFVDAQAQATADKKLASHAQKFKVAIAPGAGNKIKEWPPERFNEVAKYLINKDGALVVIIGSPADVELGRIVAKNLPQGSVIDTTGLLSIEELKALIRRMNLFVSADTGPIYIAEAFNVPTVDIVGPMDEREQPPRGLRHAVVVARRTAPQLHIMNARVYDATEARRQVESITSGMVTSEIETLLSVSTSVLS